MVSGRKHGAFVCFKQKLEGADPVQRHSADDVSMMAKNNNNKNRVLGVLSVLQGNREGTKGGILKKQKKKACK